MPRRRHDADRRRFLDEFASVKASRLRATGVIDPLKFTALITFPGEDLKPRLIATAHTWFAKGGGYSYFRCGRCNRRASKLWLVEGAPICCKCCKRENILLRSTYGFGRAARVKGSDEHLDHIVQKFETTTPLRVNQPPAVWEGRARLVYGSRKMAERIRRRMITLRLRSLAADWGRNDAGLPITSALKPDREALRAIPEIAVVWKAKSIEALEQALDAAHNAVAQALDSPDARTRRIAAKIMLNTRQARQRGLNTA